MPAGATETVIGCAKYDVETGKAIGGSKAPLVTSVATVIGLAGIGYFLTQLL